MEKAKLIVTTISLVFVLLCFAACIYLCVALPKDNADLLFFQTMACIFALATVWMGFNVWGIIKSGRK